MITQEIKDFLKDRYSLSIPSSLPEPSGYHLLVMPLCARKKIGSIIIPSDLEVKSRLASVVALVLAVGKDSYPGGRFPNGPWCQVGDFVLLERDAGSKFTVLEDADQVTTHCDGKIGMRLIADDQIKARLTSFADVSRVELNL